MSLPSSRLQRVLNEAPVPFRLGEYISKGFEFMNKNFGMLLAFMLVSTMISFFAQIVPILGIALSLLIAPVLQIGYAQFTYAVIRENRADFSEFFKGFNKIGPLVATYLLSGIIMLIALLPGLLLWFQAGMLDWFREIMEDYPFMQDIPALGESVDITLFGLGLVLMLVGILALSTLFAWALFIVWFYDVNPIDALNMSRKLIARNWGIFVLFLIISSIIGGAGALLCLVGILYTAPAMAVAQFFAFAEAARLFEDDNEQESDLIDHFIA